MCDVSCNLHREATLAFSTNDATLVVEQLTSHVVPPFQELKVHVLLVQIGEGILSVSATPLVDSHRCANPATPAVVFSLCEVPHTSYDDNLMRITFSSQHLRCTLRFMIEEQFWQMMKLIVDAKLTMIFRRKEVSRLTQQALDFIPVVPEDVILEDVGI